MEEEVVPNLVELLADEGVLGVLSTREGARARWTSQSAALVQTLDQSERSARPG